MLRNAVLNSVLPTAPDEDIQDLYFAFIDELTPTHMHLLTLLSDPLDGSRIDQSCNDRSSAIRLAALDLSTRRCLSWRKRVSR